MAEMDERDLFLKLIANLEEGAACLKGLAQLRKDARFQGLGLGMMAMREQVIELVRAKSLPHTELIALLTEHQSAAAGRAAGRRLKERVAAARRACLHECSWRIG